MHTKGFIFLVSKFECRVSYFYRPGHRGFLTLYYSWEVCMPLRSGPFHLWALFGRFLVFLLSARVSRVLFLQYSCGWSTFVGAWIRFWVFVLGSSAFFISGFAVPLPSFIGLFRVWCMLKSFFLVGVFPELWGLIFGHALLRCDNLRSFERVCNFWSSFSLIFLVKVFNEVASFWFC